MYWVLLLIFAALIGFAIYGYSSQSAEQNSNQAYFFSGRSLSGALLGCSLLATQVGGGMLVGVCDLAYDHGLLGFLVVLGQVLGFIGVLLILGKPLLKLKVDTAPQIFSKVYGSISLHKSASIISVVSLAIILVGQVVAIQKLLFSMGVVSPLITSGLWLAVVCYTAIGGFNAVVKTDLIQIGFIILGLIVWTCHIPATTFATLPTALSHLPTLNPLHAIDFLIWPAAYLIIEQDMVQRLVATESVTQQRNAVIIAVVGLLGCAAFPVLIGLLASVSTLQASPEMSVLLSFAHTLHIPWLAYLVFTIIMMAILSTVDSLLLAITSLINLDELLPQKLLNASPKRTNFLITVVIGVFTLVGAQFAENVLSTLVFSYGLTASALFVPVVGAITTKQQSSKPALFAMLVGIGCYLGLSLIAPEWRFISLLASGVTFAVASLTYRKKAHS